MTESEYKAGFNSVDNKEWIWGHAQTNDQSNASYQFHYLETTTKGSYYCSFNVDPYFGAVFEDGDYPQEMLFWATDPGADVASAAYVWMRNSKFRLSLIHIWSSIRSLIQGFYIIIFILLFHWW